jgi:hypothetical protein
MLGICTGDPVAMYSGWRMLAMYRICALYTAHTKRTNAMFMLPSCPCPKSTHRRHVALHRYCEGMACKQRCTANTGQRQLQT